MINMCIEKNSIRKQLWQEPVFSPVEGEPIAPTRHQVDVWKGEASNFPDMQDVPPQGKRDRFDLLSTRAFQAGYALALLSPQQLTLALQNCNGMDKHRENYIWESQDGQEIQLDGNFTREDLIQLALTKPTTK